MAAFLSIGARADAGLLYDASLRNGDYGGGQRVDTMGPDHGGSPHVLGIADSAEGVAFTPTEANGRSNALVNYALGAARTSFMAHGTIVLRVQASCELHASGSLWGENYGFNQFNNGQGTFAAAASRLANEPGPEDDQLEISWSAWHNNVWHVVGRVALEYDRRYILTFVWGGPEFDYELWVDGARPSTCKLPNGYQLPWGISWLSGVNWGLGDNHERGYGAYISTVGVTFADLRLWDSYEPPGSSQLSPLPPTSAEPQAVGWHFINVPPRLWYDPPLAFGYDYVMNGEALFTEILGFPSGIDGDDRFAVSVSGQALGEFGPGDTLDFEQVLGRGTAGFRVTGIEPSVDARDPVAFPLKLDFDAGLASFSMVPLSVPELSISGRDDAGVVLRWTTQAGLRYQLQAAETFPNWQPASGWVEGDGGVATSVLSRTAASEFFRVLLDAEWAVPGP